MGLNFYSTTINRTFKSATNSGTFESATNFFKKTKYGSKIKMLKWPKSSINAKKKFENISRTFKSIPNKSTIEV